MIDNLTISDLKEIISCDKMTMKQAIPVMRRFAEKHNLSDKDALKAFGMAKSIFGENNG